jgi:hypothetical protein
MRIAVHFVLRSVVRVAYAGNEVERFMQKKSAGLSAGALIL